MSLLLPQEKKEKSNCLKSLSIKKSKSFPNSYLTQEGVSLYSSAWALYRGSIGAGFLCHTSKVEMDKYLDQAIP
jgi:hypothetical protein